MKKCFTVLLALMIVMTALPMTAMAGSAPTALGAVTGTTLADGQTYSIGSEADLAKLASLVNGGEDCTGNYFVLTADITLSADHNGADAGKWVPIGTATFTESTGDITSAHAFNGSFYGQSHTVSGLDVQVTNASGLFGCIGENGVVAGLTVDGAITGANCAGGIAGISSGKIINCTNNAAYTNGTTTAYSYIGGIVGTNEGTVQNCINLADITGYKGAAGGDAQMGGIAGICHKNAKVLNCKNTGKLKCWSNAGGIVGDTNSEYTAVIKNCYNFGSLTAYGACGGVVGILNNSSVLANCYTMGDIFADSSMGTGAVAGSIGSDATAENCYWLKDVYSNISYDVSQSSSTPTDFVSFDGTDTLSSAVGGTTSLYTALNAYAVANASEFLRGWTGGGSKLPAFTGTIILSGPQDQYALPGGTQDFTALALGSPVSFQWQVSTDGTNWNDVSDGSGGNTPTYTTVAMTEAMDGYAYRCKISGSMNTDAAKLRLGAKPKITTQPVDIAAADGAPVAFTVAATGAPAASYDWCYRAKEGDPWMDPMCYTDKTLSIPMAPELNGYQFYCKVSNAFGSVDSDVATLYLAVAADITKQPENRTVTAGSTASFSIETAGKLTPACQWQVSTNNGATWNNVTNGTGQTSATYTTPATTTAMNGYQYRCKATNGAGSKTSNAAVLTVKSAQATYTVSVASGNASYGSVSGGGTYAAGASVKVTAIAKPGYAFAGWYSGKALVCANAAYTFTATTNTALTAQFDKVGIPASIKAASAGYNKIKVSWSAVKGAKGYRVYRASSKDGTYKLIKTVSAAGLTDTGLNTGATYFYKVSAYIKSGSNYLYGKYFSASASATPVLGKVSGLGASAFKTGGVSLHWSSVTGKSGYEVWRSVSPGSGFKRIKTLIAAAYKDMGLKSKTVYYYKIIAYRTVNGHKVYGGYSRMVFVKTK